MMDKAEAKQFISNLNTKVTREELDEQFVFLIVLFLICTFKFLPLPPSIVNE